MSLPNPYAQYRQTQAQTANQLKLIIMLHDGAIRFLQQGVTAMRAKDYDRKSVDFNKAGDIIAHLWTSVNPDNGEISDNLSRIYYYLQGRLVDANANDDAAIVDEIVGHLRSIRDSWVQVDRKKAAGSEPETEQVHVVPAWSTAA